MVEFSEGYKRNARRRLAIIEAQLGREGVLIARAIAALFAKSTT